MNYQKNFARFVTEILSGEKSGKKIGNLLNIAAKNAVVNEKKFKLISF